MVFFHTLAVAPFHRASHFWRWCYDGYLYVNNSTFYTQLRLQFVLQNEERDICSLTSKRHVLLVYNLNVPQNPIFVVKTVNVFVGKEPLTSESASKYPGPHFLSYKKFKKKNILHTFNIGSDHFTKVKVWPYSVGKVNHLWYLAHDTAPNTPV